MHQLLSYFWNCLVLVNLLSCLSQHRQWKKKMGLVPLRWSGAGYLAPTRAESNHRSCSGLAQAQIPCACLAKKQCGHRASRTKHLNKKESPRGVVLFRAHCNKMESRNERNQPFYIYIWQKYATCVGQLGYKPYNKVTQNITLRSLIRVCY